MATPEMQVQSNSLTVRAGSPGSSIFNTFNPDGSVLDVSTGYAVNAFKSAQTPGQQNTDVGNQDLSSHISAAFSATGVTISWTGAQASTMSGLLQVLQNQYVLFLTNDSGTTKSKLGDGSLLIDNSYNIE